jgi:Zn-dependent protease
MLAAVLNDRQNSLYVGNLGPIPLYIHWSFLFLLWMGYRWSVPSGGFDLEPVLIFLTVLLSGIVLHEMGHGLAARALGAFGITITLWAMGGLCSSTRDRLPRREIVILAAGPLVSILLAWFGILVLKLVAATQPGLLVADPDHAELIARAATSGIGDLVAFTYHYGSLLGRFLAMMWLVNLMLFKFNIMPIYPLDGGQIAFNAFSLFAGHRRAAALTLSVAVTAAVAYFAYDAYHSGRGQPNTYLLGFLALLLYNAFTALR